VKIAIIGWGSLIWNPADLPHSGSWHAGGPALPIEFSRISPDGRLTLIIDPRHGSRVVSRYSESPRATLAEAVRDLAARELCSEDGIGFLDLRTPAHSRERYPEQVEVRPVLESWCRTRALDGAVWTALPPTFERRTGLPFTTDNAVAYLDSLSGADRERAFDYVRKAPAEVSTPVREAFSRRLAPGPMRLFVYGTLRPGEPNHHLLDGVAGRWSAASVRGRIHALVGYPALILDPEAERIDGHLLESDDLERHWQRLDAFEGDEYRRVLARVELPDGRQVEAFVYVLRLPSTPEAT
jgi:gamma-glutamylcyclotransferase (GGCT)/AIG2-like uncharacterized protein YtfP